MLARLTTSVLCRSIRFRPRRPGSFAPSEASLPPSTHHISAAPLCAMDVVSDAPAPVAAPTKSLGIIYPPPELRGAREIFRLESPTLLCCFSCRVFFFFFFFFHF